MFGMGNDNRAKVLSSIAQSECIRKNEKNKKKIRKKMF